ncbi:MFS transporter [Litorisediminicola beolgyonensis]|uniref:MFS transporter n=1 Tax=Litorisediminicola beolgyonensis TaxID=1173614 RepID=A0ABW3ZIR9_9RHOB
MSAAMPQGGVIVTLSASNFAIGMGAFVVIGLLDPMAASLGISRSAAGWAMTIYALSYAILSPMLVSLTGGFGRRRVLAAAMALFAVGNTLCALAPDTTTLLAGRAVAAAGAGLFTPVSAAVAAGLAPPEARGKVLASVIFGLSLAQVFGVPAGSWIAFTFGWRVAFWLVTALALVAIVLTWTRVPKGLSFAVVGLSQLREVLSDGIAMAATLFTASFLAAIFILYTYLGPVLSDQMGYGRDAITLTLVIYGLGAVIGNVAGGWMADRLGFMSTLAILCIGQIVLMPLFAAFPLADAVVLALVFVWSAFGWSFMAAQQIRLLGLTGEKASVALAINAAAIYVGNALGAAFGGLVLERAGLVWLGPAAGVAALGALVHLLWSHRAARLRGRE